MSLAATALRAAFALAFAAVSLPLLARAADYQPEYTANPPAGMPEYVLGIQPLDNPAQVFAVYAPIANHLNERLPGIRFRLEASRSFEEFETKLFAGKFHFALANAYETVRALKRVIALSARWAVARLSGA
jgi:ABC-type phosphate/phosphonate transport system substrate-binding protein